MRWKGAGQRVLRWVLWILVLWVFVRGLVSLLPGETGPSAAALEKQPVSAKAEPPGLRAFPAMFAREYLTWLPGNPDDERAARLGPYLSPGLDRQSGWSGKEGVGQRAVESWVYGVKELSETRWLVTVASRVVTVRPAPPAPQAGEATQTPPAPQERTVFLAVPVSLTKAGGLVVSEYPSLVPAPVVSELGDPVYLGQESSDKGEKVRGLLAGFFKALFENGDVTYYLAPGTHVNTVGSGWTYDSVSKVSVYANAGETWAVADVTAVDAETGARFTFRYTLQLTERDGRWYVRQLQQKGE